MDGCGVSVGEGGRGGVCSVSVGVFVEGGGGVSGVGIDGGVSFSLALPMANVPRSVK